jgi:hypothetical protein
MTTIAATSASTFVKQIHGNLSGGIVDTYSKDLYRYQILYEAVVSKMNVFLNAFREADYVTLTDKFTRNQYNTLILKVSATTFNTTLVNNLTGFTYDSTKFNLMRESTYNVIDGLEQTIKLYQQNLILQDDVSKLVYYKNVLDDPVKLQEYINKHKLDVLPFQASETFYTTVVLKPWYDVYFQKYGPPGDGVFKSDLLAEIVLDLINSGTITEEEFINS